MGEKLIIDTTVLADDDYDDIYTITQLSVNYFKIFIHHAYIGRNVKWRNKKTTE